MDEISITNYVWFSDVLEVTFRFYWQLLNKKGVESGLLLRDAGKYLASQT